MSNDAPPTKAKQKPTKLDHVARVLLVDDHPVVRMGFAQIIDDESDMEVCGQADDAAQALRLIEQTKPDLALIDISLEKESGLELVKQIKARGDKMAVLIASMHDESLYAERAIRAGAAGFVNKREAVTELVTAIRRVLNGKIYLSEAMTDRLLNHVVSGPEAKPDETSVDALSDRELEIFEMLGRGLTAREIAQSLHLSIKTVDTYRSHIKSKLKLRNNSELSVHAAAWVLEH